MCRNLKTDGGNDQRCTPIYGTVQGNDKHCDQLYGTVQGTDKHCTPLTLLYSPTDQHCTLLYRALTSTVPNCIALYRALTTDTDIVPHLRHCTINLKKTNHIFKPCVHCIILFDIFFYIVQSINIIHTYDFTGECNRPLIFFNMFYLLTSIVF